MSLVCVSVPKDGGTQPLPRKQGRELLSLDGGVLGTLPSPVRGGGAGVGGRPPSHSLCRAQPTDINRNQRFSIFFVGCPPPQPLPRKQGRELLSLDGGAHVRAA